MLASDPHRSVRERLGVQGRASVPREHCLVIAAWPVSARELTALRDGRVATIPTRADFYMRGCLVQAWFRQPLLSGMERARW